MHKYLYVIAMLTFSSPSYAIGETSMHTPDIVYHHANDFLSNFSVPMPKNADEFIGLIRQADNGHPDANWMLAVIYSQDKDYPKAIERYEKSIGNKDIHQTTSMVNLGYIYKEKKEINKALELFERAGELGYYGGYQALGTSYLNGSGVEKDIAKAKTFFEKGSQLGCHECSWAINNWDAVVKNKAGY